MMPIERAPGEASGKELPVRSHENNADRQAVLLAYLLHATRLVQNPTTREAISVAEDLIKRYEADGGTPKDIIINKTFSESVAALRVMTLLNDEIDQGKPIGISRAHEDEIQEDKELPGLQAARERLGQLAILASAENDDLFVETLQVLDGGESSDRLTTIAQEVLQERTAGLKANGVELPHGELAYGSIDLDILGERSSAKKPPLDGKQWLKAVLEDLAILSDRIDASLGDA